MVKKRCYYDVLGVEKTASNDEIRKNYRLLALKWHPDKNPENAELAANEFRLIQEAYECLIEPHERAWYDKHKDLILSGHGRDNIEDKGLDVYQYFSSSCYNGYDDENEENFYSVYKKVFASLQAEDLVYIDEDDERTRDERNSIPDFGNSKTPYPQVKQFYAYWESYSTLKTFAWLDQYNILEAPNRRVLRLMEKENKKIRDAARKERNDEIRELVAFVRRRDRRLHAQRKITEAKVAADRERAKMARIKQINDRQKEFANYQESEWTAMSTLEDDLKEIEENLDDINLTGKKKRNQKRNKQKKKEQRDENEHEDEEEKADDETQTLNNENANSLESKVADEKFNDYNDKDTEKSNVASVNVDKINAADIEDEEDEKDFYCIVCDKAFKSMKSFENHEKSKKHKQNLIALRQTLEEDEKLLAT